jgi:hypothetical protein
VREALTALERGLAEAGFVEGRNLAFEYRSADYQSDRLPALAADLVRRRVAVIIAVGTDSALAATIPIVFGTGQDPVALGLVASLNRPDGNATGIDILSSELGPKRLQLLRELIPNAALFGVLVDPAVPDIRSFVADLQAAARTLGLQLIIENARTVSDLEPAFATLSQQHVGAVLVSPSGFYYVGRREQLAALAARHALPAVYARNEIALAGGLMSYGTSGGYHARASALATTCRRISRRSSLPSHSSAWKWLLRKEWRELMSSRSWWIMLALIGPLVGVSRLARGFHRQRQAVCLLPGGNAQRPGQLFERHDQPEIQDHCRRPRPLLLHPVQRQTQWRLALHALQRH